MLSIVLPVDNIIKQVAGARNATKCCKCDKRNLYGIRLIEQSRKNQSAKNQQVLGPLSHPKRREPGHTP
jgi:hypothetical protein